MPRVRAFVTSAPQQCNQDERPFYPFCSLSIFSDRRLGRPRFEAFVPPRNGHTEYLDTYQLVTVECPSRNRTVADWHTVCLLEKSRRTAMNSKVVDHVDHAAPFQSDKIVRRLDEFPELLAAAGQRLPHRPIVLCPDV